MRLALLAKYENIFPNETPKELPTLFKDISSVTILQTMAWINAELHYRPFEIKVQQKILHSFIGRSSLTIQKSIINKLAELNKEYDSVFVFNNLACLEIIEHELQNFRDIESPKDNIPPEHELNILKAILTKNSELDNNHTTQISDSIKRPKRFPNEYFYSASWPILFVQHEISSTRNELIQCYIGTLFIDYLISHPSLKNYIEIFINPDNSADANHIAQILRTYLLSYKQDDSKRPASNLASSVVNANPFFDSFVIDSNMILANALSYVSKDNYKSLRENPLIKTPNNNYIVTNWKYLIEKVYKSFMFSFYNSLPEGTISFNKYRSDIGSQFSEEILFNNLMRNTFSRLQGKEIINQSKYLNFDYYFRFENKIVLIEFKDTILPFSNDYDTIIKNIDNKLILEKNRKKSKIKGISQLIKNIEKISTDYAKIDDFSKDGYDKKRIIIYPVIVYTDPALMIPGVNDYLNYRFKSMLDSSSLGFFLIRSLVTIQLDFFIDKYSDFKNGTFNLIQLIEHHFQTLSLLKTIARLDSTSDNIINQFKSFEENISSSKFNTSKFIDSELYEELMSKIFPLKE